MDIVKIKIKISDIVNEYLKKYPAMTINAIAKRAGKSEGALRKVLDLENKSAPRPDTVLNFMMVILEKRNLSEVMKDSPEIIREYLGQSFPLHKENKGMDNNCPETEAHMMRDVRAFLLVWLCGTSNGATLNTIKDLLGYMGENKLEELVKVGLITEEKGVYRTKPNLWINPDIVKNYLYAFIDFIKFEEAAKGQNFFSVYSEDVTEEFQKQSVTKMKTLMNEIIEGANNSQNRGPVKMFTAMATDSLSKEKI